MSTLKTTNLQHASATTPAIVLAADSTATAQLSSLNGGQLAGTRNRIINGDMRIDQRNAGASVTASTTIQYPVDRWQVYEDTDGSFTAQRSTVAPPGFTNSLLITVTSADTSLSSTQRATMGQVIEGLNIADLAWGTSSALPITLSFWVRSSLTGTFGGVVKNSNTTVRAYAFTYSITAANTWEYKTITIPGETVGGSDWKTDSTTGLSLNFGLGVGANYSAPAGTWSVGDANSATGATSVVGTNGATFYLTGVQLEPGTVATPFERRSYGQELALCQRYYWKTYVPSVIPGTATTAGQVATIATAGGGFRATVYPKVSLRDTPSTVAAYSPVTGSAGVYRDAISGTDKAISLNASSSESFVLAEATVAAAGTAIFFHLAVSAEL